jgi:hypothetical protein
LVKDQHGAEQRHEIAQDGALRVLGGINRLGIGQACLGGDQVTGDLQCAHDDACHCAHQHASGDLLRDEDEQRHGRLRRNGRIVGLHLRRQGKGNGQRQDQAHA